MSLEHCSGVFSAQVYCGLLWTWQENEAGLFQKHYALCDGVLVCILLLLFIAAVTTRNTYSLWFHVLIYGQRHIDKLLYLSFTYYICLAVRVLKVFKEIFCHLVIFTEKDQTIANSLTDSNSKMMTY